MIFVCSMLDAERRNREEMEALRVLDEDGVTFKRFMRYAEVGELSGGQAPEVTDRQSPEILLN